MDEDEYVKHGQAIFRIKGPVVCIPHDPRLFKKYKKIAHDFVCKKLDELNAQKEFSVSKISVRNQRRRWGSCSKDGKIILNYKLIFLPLELVEYVIVHELCHTKQHNHSREFWKEVATRLPDHKERRMKLRSFLT